MASSPGQSASSGRGVNFPYKCVNCDSQPASLSICSKCRNARYCGSDCQKADWPRHKKCCIDVNKLSTYKAPAAMSQGDGVDAAHPSNPLNLRTQPIISDEEVSRLGDFAPYYDYLLVNPSNPRVNIALAAIKAAREFEDIGYMQHIPQVIIAWVKDRRDEDLCKETQEKLVEMLRDWVYRRSVLARKYKALAIWSSSVTNRSRTAPADAPPLVDAGCRAYEYVRESRRLSTVEGLWLHRSLLLKLPDDHDCSRFKAAGSTPDREIVATLLALGATGIDEACIWEIDDTVDTKKIKANDKALFAKIGSASG